MRGDPREEVMGKDDGARRPAMNAAQATAAISRATGACRGSGVAMKVSHSRWLSPRAPQRCLDGKRACERLLPERDSTANAFEIAFGTGPG